VFSSDNRWRNLPQDALTDHAFGDGDKDWNQLAFLRCELVLRCIPSFCDDEMIGRGLSLSRLVAMLNS
jgi:hypothetical protein